MTFMKNEKAFTGLEAAIVLIAFVVVAAVFSYVVLGAGFFTTQQSQETVHTGVEQASSSVELMGNVYANTTDTSGAVQCIRFTLGNTAGGSSMDISKAVLTYTSGATSSDLTYDSGNFNGEAYPADGYWTVYQVLNKQTDETTADTLIEPGEKFVVVAAVNDENLVANTAFTLELKPAVGAVLRIGRTIPGSLDSTMILY
ncbi:MAG: archaellin/type IV pilin N-terminal domain-containing protein [Methanomicrobiales archaeon]